MIFSLNANKSLQAENRHDTFNIIIPSLLLQNMLPCLETSYIFPLDQGNKKANILKGFVRSMYECLPFGEEEEARFMEKNAIDCHESGLLMASQC